MRRAFVVVPVAMLVLIAVGCSKSSGGGSGGNIGRVSVFSAMEPSEATALQAVIDKDINKNADYVATVRLNFGTRTFAHGAPKGNSQERSVAAS